MLAPPFQSCPLTTPDSQQHRQGSVWQRAFQCPFQQTYACPCPCQHVSGTCRRAIVVALSAGLDKPDLGRCNTYIILIVCTYIILIGCGAIVQSRAEVQIKTRLSKLMSCCSDAKHAQATRWVCACCSCTGVHMCFAPVATAAGAIATTRWQCGRTAGLQMSCPQHCRLLHRCT